MLAAPAGKGRGLVATEDVPAGTLLLVSVPLSIRYCSEGTTPENEELADQMLGGPAPGGSGSGSNPAGAVSSAAARRRRQLAGLQLTEAQHGLLEMMWTGEDSSGAQGGAAAAVELPLPNAEDFRAAAASEQQQDVGQAGAGGLKVAGGLATSGGPFLTNRVKVGGGNECSPGAAGG